MLREAGAKHASYCAASIRVPELYGKLLGVVGGRSKSESVKTTSGTSSHFSDLSDGALRICLNLQRGLLIILRAFVDNLGEGSERRGHQSDVVVRLLTNHLGEFEQHSSNNRVGIPIASTLVQVAATIFVSVAMATYWQTGNLPSSVHGNVVTDD